MIDKQIIIDGIDVSECKFFRNGICASPINPKCKLCVEISEKMCYYKQLLRKEQEFETLASQLDFEVQKKECLEQECEELKQTLIEIKEIAEPYKITIKKICVNCKKYDSCLACCCKDIKCSKYTTPKTKACEEFTYLDELIPNILANNILQKISEVLKDEQL